MVDLTGDNAVLLRVRHGDTPALVMEAAMDAAAAMNDRAGDDDVLLRFRSGDVEGTVVVLRGDADRFRGDTSS